MRSTFRTFSTAILVGQTLAVPLGGIWKGWGVGREGRLGFWKRQLPNCSDASDPRFATGQCHLVPGSIGADVGNVGGPGEDKVTTVYLPTTVFVPTTIQTTQTVSVPVTIEDGVPATSETQTEGVGTDSGEYSLTRNHIRSPINSCSIDATN